MVKSEKEQRKQSRQLRFGIPVIVFAVIFVGSVVKGYPVREAFLYASVLTLSSLLVLGVAVFVTARRGGGGGNG